MKLFWMSEWTVLRFPGAFFRAPDREVGDLAGFAVGPEKQGVLPVLFSWGQGGLSFGYNPAKFQDLWAVSPPVAGGW